LCESLHNKRKWKLDKLQTVKLQQKFCCW